jgi:restriction system protein
MDITKHYNYFEYTIEALKQLGGSGTNEEILEKVIQLAKLSKEQIEDLHGNGPRTVVDYQIAWAKTYLKHYGYLESSKRGIWNLTERGVSEQVASKEEINSFVRNRSKGNFTSKKKSIIDESEKLFSETSAESTNWIEQLVKAMLDIPPTGFEKLCQRVFREKGFVKVEVTGRSGDGGIDGIGTLKISLMTFKVLFQCKRYKGSVGSSEIRDFRGAMSGRADKGIFLTTGHFTKDAKEEASRDGAEPIELIDGVELCQLLKELNLGVKKEEIIVVNHVWFEQFK